MATLKISPGVKTELVCRISKHREDVLLYYSTPDPFRSTSMRIPATVVASSKSHALSSALTRVLLDGPHTNNPLRQESPHLGVLCIHSARSGAYLLTIVNLAAASARASRRRQLDSPLLEPARARAPAPARGSLSLIQTVGRDSNIGAAAT